MTNYGKSDLKSGKKVLIEHTSPNPTKALHLGHLKNNVTGLSLANLLEAVGAEVYCDAVDNNRGISVARLMWGYLKFARKDGDTTKADLEYWFDNQTEWKTPESEDYDPGLFVDELYVRAAEDEKNNQDSAQKIRKLVLDWEAEDKKNWALWKLTQEWVWEGYKKSLSRVGGWKFDKIWHEHEHYQKGKQHVERGLKEGIFKKLDDGAVLTDLSKEFGLTDTILIKNDGTSLYITQDLELTNLKKKTFEADEMYWVIGPEQSLAMKQMFAVCAQLGFGKYEDFHHIPYGFVLIKGKDGGAEKMSSRAGTQINVDSLVDRAAKDLREYIRNESINEDEALVLSEKLAVASIKYALLKVNRIQDMVFDYDVTISLEGNSGPYIEYTYARAMSIVENFTHDLKGSLTDISFEFNEEEIALLRFLEKFPEVVKNAAIEYAPNFVADYVYELAQKFNSFYNKHSVLNADSEELKVFRVTLTMGVAQVIANGLKLLGIETVEKM